MHTLLGSLFLDSHQVVHVVFLILELVQLISSSSDVGLGLIKA
jgi:hypothetical protein